MINLRDRTARHREWLAKNRLQSGFARALAPRLRKEFDRVAGDAAKAYESGKSVDEALVEHPSRVTKILIPSLIASATAFSDRAKKMIKKSYEELEAKDTETELSSRIAGFARRRARSSMARVSNTTKTRINRVIVRGIENGDDRTKIAEDIRRRTGGKVGAARAKVIATTEVHSAANAGELESVKSFDVPLRKEWMSMNDELVREDHQEVDGDEVELDDSFEVGDDKLQFPGDPDAPPSQTVNCRCIMVYNERKR